MKAIIVIGTSGAGKTALCHSLASIYRSIFGDGSVMTINLDSANEDAENHFDVTITELIQLEEIMEEYNIGPNSSLIYSIDFLLLNIDWLHAKIRAIAQRNNPFLRYTQEQKSSTAQTEPMNILIIFDLPGQAEIYLSNDSLKHLIRKLVSEHSLTACILELFDATYLLELPHFISMCMMSLASIINLEMPHVNLLNKIDMLKGVNLSMGILNDYLELTSMSEIVQDLSLVNKQKTVLTALATVIDQYSQVSFLPCSVYKKDLINYLVHTLEGIFGTREKNYFQNKQFKNITQEWRQNLALERIICNLEAELFKEENEQDIKNTINEIVKNKSKNDLI